MDGIGGIGPDGHVTNAATAKNGDLSHRFIRNGRIDRLNIGKNPQFLRSICKNFLQIMLKSVIMIYSWQDALFLLSEWELKMRVTGHLRTKRGIWQMVMEHQDDCGQRRQKSEGAGLPEKGSKRGRKSCWTERLDELPQQCTAALGNGTVLFLGIMRGCPDVVTACRVKESTLEQ